MQCHFTVDIVPSSDQLLKIFHCNGFNQRLLEFTISIENVILHSFFIRTRKIGP